MNWDSAAAFWHMGGYGLYVWGSYGVCAVLVLLEIFNAQRRWRRGLLAVTHAEFLESAA